MAGPCMRYEMMKTLDTRTGISERQDRVESVTLEKIQAHAMYISGQGNAI